ncbi:LPS export ABC transporter ATP-binding protein [Rickettsiales bacterium LUAb2]
MEKSRLFATSIMKSYGNRSILKNIHVDITQGEVVGFLGPNGSGKTTLFYIVAGLIAANQGCIYLDNEDITSLPMHIRARMGIGYLPQDTSIFRGLTVENNIEAILELYEKNYEQRKLKLENILQEFKITHIRKQPALALSGGERRRVEIARAMASSPKFILLDEPFAGIDPIAVADITNIILGLKQKNVGILITDHNVRETLEIVDKAYILYRGEILVEGNKQDVINNQVVKEVYLGDSFK